MSKQTLRTRIVHKHDTANNWEQAINFIPLKGEIVVYDKDNNYSYERFKIGDGETKVNDLPFQNVEIDSTLTKAGHVADAKAVGDITVDLYDEIANNYNETIIGLSVDGTTVTYIKGDGSSHTFETQDTDTTYSLATDSKTGLTKLYATTGNASDGTMTQKAIKTELDKKVGVSIDNSSNTLIFNI